MDTVSDRSTPVRARRVVVAATLALVVPLAVLLWHASRYYPFIADDALISLRYAERFNDGLGLTWTDGERVEGYSNLLWILLIAASGWAGLDLIVAARILGVLCFTGVFSCLFSAAKDDERRLGVPLLVGVFLALTGPFAVWSIGGLEQPLFALLLAAALLVSQRLVVADTAGKSALCLGGALALSCWTRPDAPVLVAAVSLSCFVLRCRLGVRRAARELLPVVALPVMAVLLQLSFRWLYYDDVVPNTAYIKVEPSCDRLEQGLAYVAQGAVDLRHLVVLGLMGVYSVATCPRARSRSLPALTTLIAWCAYVVAIGGDIFPAHRHLVVALVALGWLCLEGVHFLLARRLVSGSLATLGLAALLSKLQLQAPANRRAISERWEWEGQVIGQLFREGFSTERPYLAVTAAGTLPYFSKLPALDMQGLNDRHIARQPRGPGFLGHDRGDGRYVLDRAPDLVAFRGPGRGPPAFVSGMQMQRDPRFHSDYRLVRFEGHDPSFAVSKTWVRLAGRVGIAQGQERIAIPAYLLEGAVGHLDESGAMAGYLAAQSSLESPRLALGPGVWTLTLDPPNPLVTVELLNRGKAQLSADAARFGSPSSMSVVLLVKTRGIATTLRQLTLSRSEFVPQTKAVEPSTRHSLQRATAIEQPQLLRNFHAEVLGWQNAGDPLQQDQQGVSSYHPQERDGAQGSTLSPPFTVPAASFLELSLAGGADRAGVGVRLRARDRILMTWAGTDSHRPHELRFDLNPYTGAELRLEIFDESDVRWGHVEVVGLWLKQASGAPLRR